jgi:hypothetical protein
MTECPSCHTVPPTPHTDYCQNEPWLGHRNLCSSQWSDFCDCEWPDDLPARHTVIVGGRSTSHPRTLCRVDVCGLDQPPEQRPEDDPPDPVICDGRNCGGVPHG